MTVTLASGRRMAELARRAWWLAIATATWNSVEAVVALASGAVAGSIGLIGFGLDSCVEVMSAVVIIWQFTGTASADRERRALGWIAVSFFVLATYVSVQSIVSLVTGAEPERSIPGISLAVVSLIVMPALASSKRRVGRAMSSAAVVADSRQTSLCSYLSAVLLIGLLLNAALGWWWADPIAGLVIATLAIIEGRAAWRGEHCSSCDTCTPTGAVPATTIAPTTTTQPVSLTTKRTATEDDR